VNIIMTFCNDTDLLTWEPGLIGTALIASQTLLTATAATLNGNTLTVSGSLIDANVKPKQIATLTGSIAGSYAIVAVTSATTCKLSLNDESLAVGGASAPIGAAGGLGVIIRTFYPQRKIISDLLCRLASIEPADAERITNPDALARATALGTLQLIFHTLSGVSAEFKVRAEAYERLFRRELRGVRVDLDINNDGRPDVTRILRQIILERA
jgi:hypothetical protein